MAYDSVQSSRRAMIGYSSTTPKRERTGQAKSLFDILVCTCIIESIL